MASVTGCSCDTVLPSVLKHLANGTTFFPLGSKVVTRITEISYVLNEQEFFDFVQVFRKSAGQWFCSDSNNSEVRKKPATKLLPSGQIVNVLSDSNGENDNFAYFGIDSEEQENHQAVNMFGDRPFQRSAQSLKNDTDCVGRVRRVSCSLF